MSAIKDLLKKSVKDLQKELAKKKAKLQDLRFKATGTRLRDDKEIRRTKKEVARILTALKLNNNK